MKILITGANGMVANATADHCRKIGDSVTALTKGDLDISRREEVIDAVATIGPDAVINCAAYTDVDGSESNRELCRRANALGPENLAIATKTTGAAFLTISTDYVFKGDKPGLYTQQDKPDPVCYYGKAKLEGETLAKRANARTIIVRTGWIFGTGGTNFLSVMDKILAEGKKVSAISDSFGTPTFAVDLARRLRELAELDMPVTFHVSNQGKGVSFFDFAAKICEIRKYNPDLVEPVSASLLDRAAQRPVNSGLDCLFSPGVGLEPLQSWKAALQTFLSAK